MSVMGLSCEVLDRSSFLCMDGERECKVDARIAGRTCAPSDNLLARCCKHAPQVVDGLPEELHRYAEMQAEKHTHPI